MKSYLLLMVFVRLLLLQAQCQEEEKETDSSPFCELGFKCTSAQQCRGSAIIRIKGKPQECPGTPTWRKHICCPLEERKVPEVERDTDSSETNPSETDSSPFCRLGFKCKSTQQCRGSAIMRIKGKPKECPGTPTWRKHICCPLEERKVPGGCGFARYRARGMAMNGEEALQGSWPWMVALAKSGIGLPYLFCSGFLISKRHIITAAHCVDDRNASRYQAWVGHVDIWKGHTYYISDIAIPEEYKHGRFYGSIALLTLSRDVFNAIPICLPSSSEYRNVTGWGASTVGWTSIRPGGPYSRLLRQFTFMHIISNSECEEVFLKILPTGNFSRIFSKGITKDILCAKPIADQGNDICAGGTGGPLMLQSTDNKWYAVGLVSFGIRCGGEGLPGGYTRITGYLNWIRENMKNTH